MTSVLADLLDLVLPRRCGGCGRPEGVLCPRCLPTGAPFAVDVGLPVYAAAGYDGPLRAALLAYKERGRRDLAAPLARLLAPAVDEVLASVLASVPASVPVLLIAPPSSRAVAARRGGDHVQRLARLLARRDRRLGCAPGVLRVTRRVRDSAGLGVDERARNLAGAFAAAAPRDNSPGPAVLLDDVVTTGATLRESARALRDSGWSVLGAATIAATPRRFTASPLVRPT